MGSVKLDNIISKLNKKYGDREDAGIVCTASKGEHLKIGRLKTGIFSLDLATNGGIPKNKITRFLGNYSAGKTTTCLKMIARAQKDDPDFTTLWVDVEHSWDPDWAKEMGVDLDRVILVHPEYSEEAIDISVVLLDTAEFDLMVMDSIAQLTPMKEIESSSEDQQMGLAARLVNKAMRKWVSMLVSTATKGRPVTIVLINQFRDTMDMYDPVTTPGGRGQVYASSMDIKLERKKIIDSDGKKRGLGAKSISSGTGEPVACITEFLVTKNKTGPSNRHGEYVFWFQDDEMNGKKTGEVDCSDAMFHWALQLGALDKVSGKYVVVSTGEELASSKEQVRQQIFSDSDLYDVLEADIMRMISGDISEGLPEQAQETEEVLD